jgi:protein AIR1/2
MFKECPTIWRMYEYLTEVDRQSTLNIRDQLQHLTLGEGGEAYIARDEWCYNCGGVGHLGDVCQTVHICFYVTANL